MQMPTTGATATAQDLRAAMVRRAHGVRGELRVEPLGTDARRFTPGLTLISERTRQPYTVRTARVAPGGSDVLLAFEGMSTRDAAGVLHGDYLLVTGAAVRTLGADEWFVHDLVGLRVAGVDGADLGVVDEVEPCTGNDVLVVRDPSGALTRYPLVRQFVQSVDTGAGVIVVTPWEEA